MEYTVVKAPGFEMRRPATLEDNLEQLTLACDIRERATRDLHTNYPKAPEQLIRYMFKQFLLEAKEKKGISCIKAIQGFKDEDENGFVTKGMPAFIHTFVKQTQYARLKTEYQLLMLR